MAHKVDFRKTTLENAHFIGGNFYEEKFHKAILNGTEFYETTNLHEAKFTKAELNRAIFYSCELYMAFFNGTELDCVDFTSVYLNSNIDTSYTVNRAYIEKDDKRFFVESTAPWSGKLVDDVIAEIIEADKTEPPKF